MKQRPIIETHSGLGINLIDPDPETINLEDIAYGLSHQCRFGGHVSHFYSVAEHSLLCSYLSDDLDLEQKRSIFLHDAHEAYLGDIPTPIKRMLSDLNKIVEGFDRAIVERFNLEAGFNFSELKEIDHLALSIEAKELMVYREENWHDSGLKEDTPKITHFPVDENRYYHFGVDYEPGLARDLFMARAESLLIN